MGNTVPSASAPQASPDLRGVLQNELTKYIIQVRPCRYRDC
jgi:hypothetical protein